MGPTKTTMLPNVLHRPPRLRLPENLTTFCKIKTHTIHPLLALSPLLGALHVLLKLLGYLSTFTNSKTKALIHFTCCLPEVIFPISHQDKATSLAVCPPAQMGRASCLAVWTGGSAGTLSNSWAKMKGVDSQQ